MSQSMPTVTPSNEINELLTLPASEDCPWVGKILQSRVVPSLLLFLTEENDPELQVEAAKALKYIAFGTCVSTQVTIDQPVNLAHNALWDLLLSSEVIMRHPTQVASALRILGNIGGGDEASALRILGNIGGGDEYLIHGMIDSRVAFHLIRCLVHDHVKVRKEACWMITNVIAGNWHMREELFRAGVIEELVKMVKKRQVLCYGSGYKGYFKCYCGCNTWTNWVLGFERLYRGLMLSLLLQKSRDFQSLPRRIRKYIGGPGSR